MSEINTYIENMMALGCTRITFAIDNNMQPAVLVDQRVMAPAGTSIIQHQCVGTSHAAAAKEAEEKAMYCARLKPLAVAAN
jgi:hypothetical protein